MERLVNDWLFAGVTVSAVLLSICTLDPGHPLAIIARAVGYKLALFCLFGAAMVFWLRWRQGRERS